MSQLLQAKVLIVGGGPGGYVAAIRAGQLGLETVLVEGSRPGGTCLVRGCIPSKALIHLAEYFHETATCHREGRFGITLPQAPVLDLLEAMRWKSGIVDRLSTGVTGLLKRAGVKVLSGWARFEDAKNCDVETDQGVVRVTAEHVVLATGSIPVALPCLPFGGKVISSTEALSLEQVPERLAVIGAGYIGLELGSAFAKLGSNVTVIEQQKQILPIYDAELVEPLRRSLERQGVTLHLGTTAHGLEGNSGDECLAITDAAGQKRNIDVDKVLVTIGRGPLTEGWGLENMAIKMKGPFIEVDDRCATSTKNVWAIGDLTGEPMLAHKASAQGEVVAEIIAGKRRRFDAFAIPAVCFTDPEIVSVGLRPDQVSDSIETIVQQFPFYANGRALTMGKGESGGFVRIVARKADHRILGIQGVGPHLSELSAQFATLLEMGAILEDVAGIVHAHPTLSEVVSEAAKRALGHAVHI